MKILGRFLVVLTCYATTVGCGDRDHGMRVSANVLQVLLSRVVLTGEEQGWLSISKHPIIDCDVFFKPKHCLPVRLFDVTKSGTTHIATYKMVTGRNCGTIEQRLLSLRADPRRLSELYDIKVGDSPLRKDSAPNLETLEIGLAWEENEQFNPHNEKKFVMSHYLKLIKTVSVNCTNGTVVLHLSAARG